jgi:hypothetical protein
MASDFFVIIIILFLWLYSPLLGPGRFFSLLILYTVGMTPWTDIHATSDIRTHDPNVRAGEDSSCLRLRGHCDQSLWH